MSTIDVTNLKSKLALIPTKFYDKDDKEIGTLCRAWVNFNGTGTVAIREGFNVSSITDNGTGDYTINFTNAISDANYCVVSGCPNGAWDNNSTDHKRYICIYAKAVGSFSGYIGNPGNTTKYDENHIMFAVFR